MEGNVSRLNFGADHHGTAIQERVSRNLTLFAVGFALALLASFVWQGSAYAAADDSSAAQRTAQQLLGRLGGSLDGATAGTPVLVYSSESGRPEYYIVPLERGGRTRGLAGVSVDGRSWQWYTDTYSLSLIHI